MIKFLSAEVVQVVMFVGIIVFGAIVHATAQLKVARDTGDSFDGVDFVINAVIASFSGLIFGLLATVFFQNIIVVILFAAIGAFLGLAGLNKISNVLLEFLVSRVDDKR